MMNQAEDPEPKAKSAELLIAVPVGVGVTRYKFLLGLADTGTSSSLANRDIFEPITRKKKTESNKYETQVGVFETTHEVKIDKIRLP